MFRSQARRSSTTIASVLLTASALSMLSGCGAESGSPDGAEPAADAQPLTDGMDTDLRVLATVTPSAGVTVQFVEGEPYGVLAITDAEAGAELPELLRKPATDALELYRELSGEEAPDALVEAVELSEQLAAAESEGMADDYSSLDMSHESQVAPDVAITTAPGKQAHFDNHSYSQWLDHFCDDLTGDYTDCRGNRVCSNQDSSCTLYSASSWYLWGAVNPYRGNLRFKLLRKNTWGNWKTRTSIWVNQGTTRTVNDFITWKRGQRLDLESAGGDAFHYAVQAMN